jgi:hypothetical protein
MNRQEKFFKAIQSKWMLFAIIFYIISPKFIFSFPGLSLDPSYILALNKFSQEHWNFGETIVFTYGPLNFLSTKLCITPLQQGFSILINLFMAIGLTRLIMPYFQSLISNKQFLSAVILLSTLVFFPILSIDFTLSLLVIYYALSVKYIRKPDLKLLTLISILPVISFFIKLNTGIILELHFLCLIAFSMVKNKDMIRSLSAMLVNVSLLFFFSILLNVSIFDYVVNSLEIIKGYNETSSLVPARKDILFTLTSILFISSSIILVLFKSNDDFLSKVFLLFTFSFAIFIIFKQAMIRADYPHVVLYFTCSFFLLLFVIKPPFLIQLNLLPKILLTLSLITNMLWFVDKPAAVNHLKLAFKPPFYQLATPYASILNERYQESKLSRKLPAKFLNKINQSTIDILPWEQTFIIYNDLKYNPRPVFQTYLAYTYHLDSLNAKFINSLKAPDFLLFSNHSIDNRNPFWEETYTKLAIKANYELVDSSSFAPSTHPLFHTSENVPVMALLKKRSKPLRAKLLRTLKKEFNSEYTINLDSTNNIVLLIVDFDNTTKGKLRSLLFQSIIAEASLLVEGKWSRRFRVFPSISKRGIIINKAILNTGDAMNFISGNLNEIPNVSSIKFYFHEVASYINLPKTFTLEEYQYQ